MRHPQGRDPLTVAVVVVLACATGWAVLLVAASFVLPLVTESSGRPGWQPRVPLVQHFGPGGVLPALALLAAVLVVGSLLGWGRRTPPALWRTAAAAGCTGTVAVAGLVAVVFTHLAGLLTLPVGPLLLAAVVVAAARQPVRQHGLPGPASLG